MTKSSDPDVLQIINQIDQSGLKKKAVAEMANITSVHLSYILNGTRNLTEELKDKLFSILELS